MLPPPVLPWSDPPRQLTPLSLAEADALLADLDAALARDGHEALAAALRERPALRALIGAVMSLSPFLRSLMLVRPARLAALLTQPPRAGLDAILSGARVAWREAGREGTDERALMAALRNAKAEVALLTGLADLGGWWDWRAVTGALADFADAAVGAAVDHLLAALARAGKVELADAQAPSRGSGLVVLAMGKHGARELNYSSDIDLILFDAPAAMTIRTDEPGAMWGRFARSLVRILQERTGEGYVFRTDLRLRPDPGSTPLVLPVATALHYYEAYGQNWERAALIKARPAAGDIAAGEAFLREITPFVWRRYLDYAAIADIHSIKRQIHAHRGHGRVAVAGHNIKLGRGGIREIEFFAQTQQLIAGGRLPALRAIRTLDALDALAAQGWIDETARDELSAAYGALRDIEHRLQMVSDEQTHTMPADEAGLTRIALMAGEPDAAALTARLTGVLRTVERHYAALFEASPQLAGEGGNLVFTGDDDDPGTVETLARLGFAEPSTVIATVRGWHYGRLPAMRSAPAREFLTELTPKLLEAIALTGEPDRVFLAFDRFMAGLPAGIQLFALLARNPGLLGLLLTILGAAPRLAGIITRRPHVFDALLDPAFAGQPVGSGLLDARLREALSRAGSFEARLDTARRFVAEQRFLIGARLISGIDATPVTGRSFADLADVAIAAMLDEVRAAFAARHGTVPGMALCVLGMGRLGARSLTAGSDLDLILLYEHAPGADASDGDKPLAASLYFTRLAQRLIAAMSAPTAEGRLYELDFRLRPSGNAGPLATPVESFLRYQESQAWTWEHQALVRARPVAGDLALCERVAGAIEALIAAPRDPAALAADIAAMRGRIEAEKGSGDPFALKTAPGGLIDIEFIAQWLALRQGRRPAQAPTATDAILREADEALLPAGERETLLAALRLQEGLGQWLQLCIEQGPALAPGPAGPPGPLARFLADEADLPDLAVLTAHLREVQARVRAIFSARIGAPEVPGPA